MIKQHSSSTFYLVLAVELHGFFYLHSTKTSIVQYCFSRKAISASSTSFLQVLFNVTGSSPVDHFPDVDNLTPSQMLLWQLQYANCCLGCKVLFFTLAVVQAVNTSTRRKRVRSTAPTGSVASNPNLDLTKRYYIIEHVS